MSTAGWLLLGGLIGIGLLVLDGSRRAAAHKARQKAASRVPHQQEAYRESDRRSADQAENDDKEPALASLEGPSSPQPQSAPSAETTEYDPDQSFSLIGPSLHVVGKIEADEPVSILGKLDGTLSAPNQRVGILAGARVSPRVEAQELILSGSIFGDASIAGCAIFEPDASFQGDLSAERLQCEVGAELSGRFNISGS
ncbi:protein CcmA, bactofilin family [Onishia taeanensis]|uniref:Protein CcmA, bactofilin family n=1 Tax=Onishia taeanensis TaxID=284577 RepID=A0A1G7SQG0_9GAMM|nr:polymer-forming cytoskeletal protein [Halomonas taeanensis]SDG25132.1 protein CcmA, bactofilin family [Halomonas taeanensis]